MSIRVKKNYLVFNGQKFKCAIGKSGFTNEKLEGDGCTPTGSYNLKKIYFRSDKIKLLKTKIKTFAIKKSDGWCDDPDHMKYNQLVQFPFQFSAEKLFRNDNLYNIIGILNYNTDPIIQGKGSAIFVHVAKENYEPTEGCIALKQEELIFILNSIETSTEIILKD